MYFRLITSRDLGFLFPTEKHRFSTSKEKIVDFPLCSRKPQFSLCRLLELQLSRSCLELEGGGWGEKAIGGRGHDVHACTRTHIAAGAGKRAAPAAACR